jgi:hypothetical protein
MRACRPAGMALVYTGEAIGAKIAAGLNNDQTREIQ